MPFERKAVVSNASGAYVPHRTLSPRSTPSYKTLPDDPSPLTALGLHQSSANPPQSHSSRTTTVSGVSGSGKTATSFRKKKDRLGAVAGGALSTIGSATTWGTMSTVDEDTRMDDALLLRQRPETLATIADPSSIDGCSVSSATPTTPASYDPARATASTSDVHFILASENSLSPSDDNASTVTKKRKKKEKKEDKKERKERKKEKKEGGRRLKEYLKTASEPTEDGQIPLTDQKQETDADSVVPVAVAKDISHALKKYIRQQSIKLSDAVSRDGGNLGTVDEMFDSEGSAMENIISDILIKKEKEVKSSFARKNKDGDTRPIVRITDWTDENEEQNQTEHSDKSSEIMLDHPLDPVDDLNDPSVRYSVGGSVYTRRTVDSDGKQETASCVSRLGDKSLSDDSVDEETATVFSPSGSTPYRTIVDGLDSADSARAPCGSSDTVEGNTVHHAIPRLDLRGSQVSAPISVHSTGPTTSVSEGPTVFDIFSDGDDSPVDLEAPQGRNHLPITEMMDQIDIKTAESLASSPLGSHSSSAEIKSVGKKYKGLSTTASCGTWMRPSPVVVKDQNEDRKLSIPSLKGAEDLDVSSPSLKGKIGTKRPKDERPFSILAEPRASSEPLRLSSARNPKTFRATISTSGPLACYGSILEATDSPMVTDRDWSMVFEEVFVVHGTPVNVTVTVPSLDVSIGVINVNLEDVDLSWDGESLKIHNVLLDGPCANEWFGALSSLKVIVYSDDLTDPVELFSHMCFVERLRAKGGSFSLKPYWNRLADIYQCHSDPMQICQAVVSYNSFESPDISGSIINLAIKTPQRMNQLREYVLNAFEHFIFTADAAIDGIRAIEGIVDFEFPEDIVEGILAVLIAITDLYAEEDHGVAVTVLLFIHKLLALHPEEDGVDIMKEILSEKKVCAKLESALADIDDPDIQKELTFLNDFVHPGFFASWSFW
eukprot:GEMP01005449.1.p1 GENE.GEMP01005449.1~~GEMP01005449.1.p1  ORF type:complete len:946 (+),score=187.67 GEMP01005449.1:162-2999(+)